MPKEDVEDDMVDEKDEFIENVDEIDAPNDEKAKKMDEGELESDVYSEVGREKEVEDDEIADWEEGFAKGAEGGGKDAKCRFCGKILKDKEDVVERRIDGNLCFFCSDDHIQQYMKKQKNKK
ncbi:MAG: hypothetical protein NT001_03345 [Candidatus Woesearchaeota archaeon]|nr:hypothetical protein [Candidatus Woesearchaeota archaeon]